MNLLPRLLGLGLLAVLVSLLVLTSCESVKRGAGETATPSKSSSTGGTAVASDGRAIAQLDSVGKVSFKTPQATLAAAFIRQFNDGTVIDKIIVRKAPPANPGEKTTCFLVGMGLKNGNFRAMALPLTLSSDGGTYYLPASAARYTLTGIGCPACYFSFDDGGSIVGSSCSENSGGSSCDLKVEPTNALFASR